MKDARIVTELEAYLDGAAEAPEELASDPEYRRVYEELLELRAILADQEPPPMSTGFSQRAANHVKREGRSAVSAWWRKLSGQAWHPIVSLLDTQGRRASLSAAGYGMLFALFALPGLSLAGLSQLGMANPIQFDAFFLVGAVATMIGLPAFFFRTDVATLTRLRRGRCLEDLLCAGVQAGGMVDTLALYSVRAIAAAGLPALAGMSVGLFLLPGKTGAWAWAALLLWLPATALLFWFGSYLMQFVIVWSRGGSAASVPLVLMSVASVLTLGVSTQLFFLATGRLSAVPVLVLALAAPWLARSLAVWGLTNPGALDRWLERGWSLTQKGAQRNPFVGSFGDNAILHRETVRRAADTPWGLFGVFLSRVGPGVFAVCMMLAADRIEPNLLGPGLACLILMALWQSSSRAVHLILSEKEGGTWETLLGSGADRYELLRGWGMASAFPVLLSFLPAACMAALGIWLNVNGMFGWLVGLALMTAPFVGAMAGLAVALGSHTRRQVSVRLLTFLGLGVGAVVVIWAVLAGYYEDAPKSFTYTPYYSHYWLGVFVPTLAYLIFSLPVLSIGMARLGSVFAGALLILAPEEKEVQRAGMASVLVLVPARMGAASLGWTLGLWLLRYHGHEFRWSDGLFALIPALLFYHLFDGVSRHWALRSPRGLAGWVLALGGGAVTGACFGTLPTFSHLLRLTHRWGGRDAGMERLPLDWVQWGALMGVTIGLLLALLAMLGETAQEHPGPLDRWSGGRASIGVATTVLVVPYLMLWFASWTWLGGATSVASVDPVRAAEVVQRGRLLLEQTEQAEDAFSCLPALFDPLAVPEQLRWVPPTLSALGSHFEVCKAEEVYLHKLAVEVMAPSWGDLSYQWSRADHLEGFLIELDGQLEKFSREALRFVARLSEDGAVTLRAGNDEVRAAALVSLHDFVDGQRAYPGFIRAAEKERLTNWFLTGERQTQVLVHDPLPQLESLFKDRAANVRALNRLGIAARVELLKRGEEVEAR